MAVETAALLISVVSLVLAGLSLGWQIAQWLLSAGRPKAALLHGIWQGTAAYVRDVGRDGAPFDTSGLRHQGIDGQSVVGIRVTNHGRAPVTVVRVEMRARGGDLSVIPPNGPMGPSLPYRLEPGTSASWYMDADDAVALASISRGEVLHQRVTGVYMVAELGTGKAVVTPRTLRA